MCFQWWTGNYGRLPRAAEHRCCHIRSVLETQLKTIRRIPTRWGEVFNGDNNNDLFETNSGKKLINLSLGLYIIYNVEHCWRHVGSPPGTETVWMVKSVLIMTVLSITTVVVGGVVATVVVVVAAVSTVGVVSGGNVCSAVVVEAGWIVTKDVWRVMHFHNWEVMDKTQENTWSKWICLAHFFDLFKKLLDYIAAVSIITFYITNYITSTSSC